LAKAARSGRLRRNFQGYTTDTADVLIGVGASAIARLPQGYAQNAAVTRDYLQLAVVVGLMLLITYYLAIKVKCPGSTSWLIGFGTAICGSSAIAALAPGVSKSREDVGIAMAVINLFGSLGMIALPLLLVRMDWSTTQLGLLLGGSLHSVGNVAGAGYSVSNEVGEAAITIKLARVALLSPALIFFNFLVNRHEAKNWKQHFILPWYLWSFIGITFLTSFVQIPASFLGLMDTMGKIVLTVGMAAIGLKVSFRKLFVSGRKGVVFGLIVFAVQLSLLALLALLV
ncbi:MAG TPA: putative sulfate exporter family transporter, partial [Lacibacter sp.]|nr:putative sulfate exporter family transporter [Lacibacter sp.]